MTRTLHPNRLTDTSCCDHRQNPPNPERYALSFTLARRGLPGGTTDRGCNHPRMPDDSWAPLTDPFVEGAYASVKGQVRTFVLHSQLLRHLPEPPATVLDVGGGAAHQSLPLARLGYQVTVLDPSPAMLAKAEHPAAVSSSTCRSGFCSVVDSRA